MPISPNEYGGRAANLERIAADIPDPALKARYLQVARELRDLANESDLDPPAGLEVEHLAESRVGAPSSKQ